MISVSKNSFVESECFNRIRLSWHIFHVTLITKIGQAEGSRISLLFSFPLYYAYKHIYTLAFFFQVLFNTWNSRRERKTHHTFDTKISMVGHAADTEETSPGKTTIITSVVRHVSILNYDGR